MLSVKLVVYFTVIIAISSYCIVCCFSPSLCYFLTHTTILLLLVLQIFLTVQYTLINHYACTHHSSSHLLPFLLILYLLFLFLSFTSVYLHCPVILFCPILLSLPLYGVTVATHIFFPMYTDQSIWFEADFFLISDLPCFVLFLVFIPFMD